MPSLHAPFFSASLSAHAGKRCVRAAPDLSRCARAWKMEEGTGGAAAGLACPAHAAPSKKRALVLLSIAGAALAHMDLYTHTHTHTRV